MTTLARNAQRLIDSRFGGIFSRFLQTVPPDTVHNQILSRKNASFHYDLGNDLYELFLDEGMNYSCAFWPQPDIDLRQAQLNKIHAIIGRLGVAPGMRVLEIGCGWGETASIMAREVGAASVTGLTLADRQLTVAKERADTPDLKNRCTSNCRITAITPRLISAFTTASIPSACSSMSAPMPTVNISARSAASWLPAAGRWCIRSSAGGRRVQTAR